MSSGNDEFLMLKMKTNEINDKTNDLCNNNKYN